MTTTERPTRETIVDMMTAYKQTSLLKAGITLGVFQRLAAGPASTAVLAADLGLDVRGARLLLNALTALRLLEADDDTYQLGDAARAHLVRESPTFFGDMVHVMASDWEWDALKRLPEAVSKGGAVVDEHAETPEYRYWEAFAEHATAIAAPTANVLCNELEPWATQRNTVRTLDMAAGHGIYGFTVAQRFPQAQITALDWANVLPIAERRADRMGVGERVELLAGDMFEVPLDGPYDLVLITNVLHHFSESRATELLRRARAALKPDGRLGLVGFTLGDGLPQNDPEPHLFSILMLVWTAQGEVHSEQAYHRMLAAAGFGPPQLRPVAGLPLRAIVAAPDAES